MSSIIDIQHQRRRHHHHHHFVQTKLPQIQSFINRTRRVRTFFKERETLFTKSRWFQLKTHEPVTRSVTDKLKSRTLCGFFNTEGRRRRKKQNNKLKMMERAAITAKTASLQFIITTAADMWHVGKTEEKVRKRVSRHMYCLKYLNKSHQEITRTFPHQAKWQDVL